MGGGVMRSIAKPAVLTGHLLSAIASSSATSIAAAEGQLAPSAVSAAGVVPSAPALVQNQIDDWKSVSPPRRVFGPPPTIEEAKEAIADLKEALDIASYRTSHIVDESHGRTSVPHCEAKGCDANFGSAVFPSLPTSIKQASALLQGSTRVQEVVASLAADKSVWGAVMENVEVVRFFENYQTTLPSNERVADDGENTPMHENQNTEASSSTKRTWKNMFFEYTTKIKKKISEKVSNSSELLQLIFERLPGSSSSSWTESTTPENENSSPRTESTTAENENAMYKNAFVSLVIAIIMVVVLKRI